MKTLPTLFIAMAIASFLLISCDESDPKEQPVTTNPVGELLNSSDCKFNLKSASFKMNESTPDSLSCIRYSYNNETKVLTIKHINAGFNCCPDSLYSEIGINNGVITIEEFEADALCNCNCVFDLEFEITEIEAQLYQIQFIEPYADDDINFEINLLEENTGSYCVTRTSYPWGMGIL